MPTREYRCRVCGQGEERVEAWDATGPTCCPYCRSTAYHRTIFAPTFHLKGGGDGRMVGGDRPFIRERVVRNADGSETKYSSLREARYGELERARRVLPEPHQGLARTLLAKKNAHDLASGMLPGRDSTKLRQAMEEPRR